MRSPLFIASREGHFEIVRELLNQPDIDIYIKTSDGFTALMVASLGFDPHLEICTLLESEMYK